MTERKAEKILIETGETTGFDENFGISDLQPVEETSSFSPNVVQIQDAPSSEPSPTRSPTTEAGAATSSTAIAQRSRKVTLIIVAVVSVVIIAVVLIVLLKKEGPDDESTPPRPPRPPGHMGACSIVKEADANGILTFYHNVSILNSELEKPDIIGATYEYAQMLSVPEDYAEEKDAQNFIAFIFPATPSTTTIIFRFDGCSASKKLPIAEYEFGAGKVPANKRAEIEAIVEKAKESAQFDCRFETLPVDGDVQSMLTFTMLAEFDFMKKRFQVKKCGQSYESCSTIYSTEDPILKPESEMPTYIVPSWSGGKYFKHKSPPLGLSDRVRSLRIEPIKFLRAEITDCIGRYRERDGTVSSKIL